MRQLLCLAAAALLSACAQQAPVKLYSGAEQPASQVLVVEMPNTLEVLNINGQPAPEANRMVGNSTRQLELQPGKYQVSAYFENGYDVGGGLSHEIVRTRSATFIIDGKAGETWRLEFDEPKTLQQAQEMEDNFEGYAVNTRTGERVASQPGPRYVSMLGQVFGAGSGMVATQDHGIAPIGAAPQATAQVPMAVPTPSQAAAPAQTLPHDASTLATLKQIYLMLSPESRDAFLEWAAQ
ncbi:DUF2057 family protein [Halopseudomonas aestusnigri]|jgi:hypothetical protein|uniref:DUF2057 family protein n=1 Tax=Halopseudomonas aestusnigri TaxID=857252 RepID=UPI000C9260E4|nr:hypothetical protein [Pseudomonadales bacterium]HBT57468.1 hypothetical protein [Pseudomonas sp.]HCP04907.1 hypothetical protein [Pseudomonas sp.]|tara:strand:+ start:1397 stop:2110 length:714 start_codon:yes stop_codon:yes gene_type:complete